MRHSVSLRTRLVALFSAIAMLTLAYSMVMLWNTTRTDRMISAVLRNDLLLYQLAQEMELALANQKGFLTYYLVDGNELWLDSLGQYRQVFKQKMDRAMALPLNAEQMAMLKLIAQDYELYREAKDAVIADYLSGTAKLTISPPHARQRDEFFQLLQRCEAFRKSQWQTIAQAEITAREWSRQLRLLAYFAIAVFAALCGFFLQFLYRQILGPIRNLAIESGGSPRESSMDEVESLGHSLKDMMHDFDRTYDELARSRRNLLQAERMAMVGELAAGVAHSIRNPFTSIKMRMFSLSRSLKLSEVDNEDLQVISAEIDRIDNIVKSFIEFSRPPKLRLEWCRLSDLIDSVAVLLEYRLEQYHTVLSYSPKSGMRPILADPDRIREAVLNLITNSCEAMAEGGSIQIVESRRQDPALGEVAVLTVRDTGSGIPEELRDQVIMPFFTTKEEGSGLGLSIVARIVREHGGALTVGGCDAGAEIIMVLPVSGGGHEPDSDN